MINDSVHAGRDVIQGDQYNYQFSNIETPAQFIHELQRLQEQIDSLKQEKLNAAQLRNLEVAEKKLTEAKNEAQRCSR